MKIIRHSISAVLTATLLLTGSARLQAVPNFTVAAFATGTQGENNPGGQYNGDCLSVGYGNGTIWWDGNTFDAADGSTGSGYLTCTFNNSDNTEAYLMIGPGYNNWYYEGDSGSCPTGTVDGTQYHALQFDILWDTNSGLTPAEFNTGNGWPTSYFVEGAGPDYMTTNSYYTGLDVSFFTGSGGNSVQIGTLTVPVSAATGWQTVSIPYSDTLAGLGPVAGVLFSGYFGAGGGLAQSVSGAFWVDNMQLIGNQTVSAPPTLNPPTPATPGLNIFNASVGTGSYPYSDRNEVLAKPTSGLTWVGNTPASYSFNMAGFPKGSNYTGEAYMFLIPNATAADQAADYNEANCVMLEIQSTATGGQASLQYKVNNPNSETYSNLITIPTTKILGTYTLAFSGNDAGSVTTPDGTVSNFTLPSGTGATYFTENASAAFPFLMYLGGQPNDLSFINKSVAYQSVTVTGPPNGSTVTENFVTDANAATPALQNWGSTWSGNGTTDPAGNVLVPSSAAYWVGWSLPSSGFSLVDTASLSGKIDWNTVATFTPVSMYNIEQQLVGTADLVNPSGNQYFAMVHRTFSQLLVVLPGETLAPGTATGKSGTPTSYSLSANGGVVTVNATVYAVDSNFDPVSGITDEIAISDNSGGIDPNNAPLVNGSAVFPVYFLNTASGVQIMAADASTPTILSSTSSAFNINP